MADTPRTGGNLLAPLIVFGMTSVVAAALFIWAFVMWLASLTGSVAIAALITACFFALLAAAVYLLAVRTAVAVLRDRLETVYDVATRVRDGYQWLADKFSFLSVFRRSR